MTSSKRGKVWLAVSGMVVTGEGKWLVVKKKYGGLKDKWSFPAGFVDEGETADEAVIREIFEETGIACELEGMIGLRTGVIRNEISDNMILFKLKPKDGQEILIQENEIVEAKFAYPDEIVRDEHTSVMLKYMLGLTEDSVKPAIEGINPGDQFQYTSYKIFL